MGLASGEQPISWSRDGQFLDVYQPEDLPAKVYKVDLNTGHREFWKQLMPSDPAGVALIGPILMSSDASMYLYGYHRALFGFVFGESLK